MGSIYWSTKSVISIVLLTTWLYLALNEYLAQVISSGKEELGLDMYSIVNVPQWYLSRDWGLRKDKDNPNIQSEFIETMDNAENMNEQILWHNFFFETSHALLLTVGDIPFQIKTTWVKSIIIDGDSKVDELRMTHPDTLILHAALCSSGSGEGLPCIHLTDILATLNISHLNIFMLSARGRELDVLRMIDFGKTSFDVILVETNPDFERNENIITPVVDFMTSRGYIVWALELGTNSWFTSPNFKPFKNPKLPEPGLMMYL